VDATNRCEPPESAGPSATEAEKLPLMVNPPKSVPDPATVDAVKNQTRAD